MTPQQLKKRTKQFALRAMKLVDALPNTRSGRTVSNQLIRSATSVGANYRAACRARSTKEFASRIGIVEEEADESAYWLELVIEAPLLEEPRVRPLHAEATELVAIMTASGRTARQRSKKESAIRNSQSAIRNRKSTDRQ